MYGCVRVGVGVSVRCMVGKAGPTGERGRHENNRHGARVIGEGRQMYIWVCVVESVASWCG